MQNSSLEFGARVRRDRELAAAGCTYLQIRRRQLRYLRIQDAGRANKDRRGSDKLPLLYANSHQRVH